MSGISNWGKTLILVAFVCIFCCFLEIPICYQLYKVMQQNPTFGKRNSKESVESLLATSEVTPHARFIVKLLFSFVSF